MVVEREELAELDKLEREAMVRMVMEAGTEETPWLPECFQIVLVFMIQFLSTRWSMSMGSAQAECGYRWAFLAGKLRCRYRISSRLRGNGYVCGTRPPFPNLSRNLFPSAEVFWN
jgi:hypothetical protein